ncbi:MAG: tRNA (N(6)-L-threonylcarbamoyladenosine(37)-C(2))-methylthiotransferase MtaB [Nitrospinota bacterium]|nr:tRNA (N(6)-L-threonylcarbamoyladenosine(37)-C(2))-methylthiotransferase MtaB [Nitrospinota bacterium]
MKDSAQLLKRKRLALVSLGCKLNHAEGEAMRHKCSQAGFDLVPFNEEADIYVVNSCTVTSEADRETKKLARRARRMGKKRASVVIAGCSPQANVKAMSIPEVDLLLGNTEKLDLPNQLSREFSSNSFPEICVGEIPKEMKAEDSSFPYFDSQTRAFMKVQDGCDFSCSFCATTIARGPSRSLSLENCLDNAKQFASNGHREIVLTGIHLGAYGKDFRPRLSLSKLSEALLDLDDLVRIRFSSVEPGEVTRELVKVVARNTFQKKEGKFYPYFCRHFHIPVQSGDDFVLKSMKRNYKIDRCTRRFHEISSSIRGVCLGGDFIVGFPEETRSAFNKTLDWVRESPISYLHVFPYSERKGTDSSLINFAVDPKEKKRRADELRVLGQRKWSAFVASQIGTEAEVLFESRNKEGLLSGLTDNYIRVVCDARDSLIGQHVKAQLEPMPTRFSSVHGKFRSDYLWARLKD